MAGMCVTAGCRVPVTGNAVTAAAAAAAAGTAYFENHENARNGPR